MREREVKPANNLWVLVLLVLGGCSAAFKDDNNLGHRMRLLAKTVGHLGSSLSALKYSSTLFCFWGSTA